MPVKRSRSPAPCLSLAVAQVGAVGRVHHPVSQAEAAAHQRSHGQVGTGVGLPGKVMSKEGGWYQDLSNLEVWQRHAHLKSEKPYKSWFVSSPPQSLKKRGAKSHE